MPSKLQHALALAAKGFYVFPVETNGKTPIVPWREKSSIDPATIKNWFIDKYMGWEQDYNIGIDCGKSGIYVLDIDCKAGKPGMKSLKELEKQHDLPETYTIHTPSGGLHFYYRAVGLRNTSEALAPGIDTRGDGGYVVAAGSVIDGKEYKAEDLSGGKLPELPTSLAQSLSAHASLTGTSSGKEIISVDDEGDIETAIEFLKQHDPAVQGNSGDQHTFNTICMLKEYGLSPQKALEILEEHWNPECSPPWEHADLVKKVKSAYKSAHNATGSKSASEFDGIKSNIKDAPKPPPPKLFYPWEPVDAKDIPPRDWVFGNMALRKYVTVIVAPAGTGKSSFMLEVAASKATGKNILGIEPHGQGRVVVYNNEDDLMEQNRRLCAVRQHFRIPTGAFFDEDVLGARQECMLSLNSGEKNPLRIAKRNKEGQIKPHHLQQMIDELIANKVDMLVVDPFAETHPASENSNEEMLTVGTMYRYVAQMANCAVVLVHHTRKLDGASSEGHSGNLDSMRGASSLGGVARVVFTLYGMTEREGKEYGIKADQRKNYILLENAKANMSAPGTHRLWYERYGEVINASAADPDGESVGILKPVKLTPRREQHSDAVMDLIRDIESIVEAAPKSISAVVNELISNFALHSDKHPPTLKKTIHRLFEEDDKITSPYGLLHVEEREAKGNQPRDYIVFTLTKIKPTLAELL